MPDIIIALIAPLASVGGTALICRVALKLIKIAVKKSESKVEELEYQNKLLEEQNKDLKDSLKSIVTLVETNCNNQKNTLDNVELIMDTQKIQSDLIRESLNAETTIRNELRTLLKKEE